MKVLVACEFSGIVRDAFIARGHDAWSRDSGRDGGAMGPTSRRACRMSVSLHPLRAEERDEMLALFASVQVVDQHWRGWAAIDSAARFVAAMRYGIGGDDPLTLLAELEQKLRELR